jgi:hypothetical protein
MAILKQLNIDSRAAGHSAALYLCWQSDGYRYVIEIMEKVVIL